MPSSITRATGRDMLLTRATYALLEGDHGGFEECERVELRGKTEEVGLYSPEALGAPDYSAASARARSAATPE